MDKELLARYKKGARLMFEIYCGGGRATGRTTALIEGMKNQPHHMLVVHNQTMADDLKRRYPDLDVKHIANHEKLLGIHKCILPDHFMVQEHLSLANRVIEMLEAELNLFANKVEGKE